jgi:N4-gp56 family major capsid protein
MAIMTTTQLSAQVEQSFCYKILTTPTPNFIHNIPAVRRQMPANGGSTLRQLRYNALDSALVPLGNSGIAPAPQALSGVNIDGKISFYGTYIIINEQVTLTNQSPVLNQASKRLGVSLRQTEDELMRNVLASTASTIYATGGFNGDNPTNLTRSDVNEVIRTLLDNDAVSILDEIEGENRFGKMCAEVKSWVIDLEPVVAFI